MSAPEQPTAGGITKTSAEYERIGVREYVIVDRFDHRVLVLTLQNGEYAEAELGPNDFYTTPLLPCFEIPLSDIIPIPEET